MSYVIIIAAQELENEYPEYDYLHNNCQIFIVRLLEKIADPPLATWWKIMADRRIIRLGIWNIISVNSPVGVLRMVRSSQRGNQDANYLPARCVSIFLAINIIPMALQRRNPRVAREAEAAVHGNSAICKRLRKQNKRISGITETTV